MSGPQEFIAAARTFEGAPWYHQGQSSLAVDCVGLVVLSARAIGIDVSLPANYGHSPDYGRARGLLQQFCTRVGKAEPGDIAIFKNPHLLHVAIITEVVDELPVRIIHAVGPKSKVAETGLQFTSAILWRPKWPS